MSNVKERDRKRFILMLKYQQNGNDVAVLQSIIEMIFWLWGS